MLLNGVVHADPTCSPDRFESHVCIGIDKTAYTTGDTIHFTVEAIMIGRNATLPYTVIVMMTTHGTGTPADMNVTYTAYEYVNLTFVSNAFWVGHGTLTIPTSATAGASWLYGYVIYYLLQVLEPDTTTPSPTPSYIVVAEAEFTVTAQPVAETPSVMALLLPALLVGIYVSKRGKS